MNKATNKSVENVWKYIPEKPYKYPKKTQTSETTKPQAFDI